VPHPVDFRAFRGSRRSSVYREHVLDEADFARILNVADREGLTVLASLDRHGPHRLDKAAARRLADEATHIRTTAVLPELDDDLTAIASVAHWCARASDNSWLRIEGT
jgi:hypothetical protein